jgi:hypothetical protein
MTMRADLPDRPYGPEGDAWRAWMRAHGIDPRDVPCGEWVEVDGRVIRYVSVVRDGERRPRYDRQRGTFMAEVRECQVYGRRPAPFPSPIGGGAP